jgi:hypothetical protein
MKTFAKGLQEGLRYRVQVRTTGKSSTTRPCQKLEIQPGGF